MNKYFSRFFVTILSSLLVAPQQNISIKPVSFSFSAGFSENALATAAPLSGRENLLHSDSKANLFHILGPNGFRYGNPYYSRSRAIKIRPSEKKDLAVIRTLRKLAFSENLAQKPDSEDIRFVVESRGEVVGMMACRLTRFKTIELGESMMLPDPILQSPEITRVLIYGLADAAQKLWGDLDTVEAFTKQDSESIRVMQNIGFVQDARFHGTLEHAVRFFLDLKKFAKKTEKLFAPKIERASIQDSWPWLFAAGSFAIAGLLAFHSRARRSA